MVSHRKCQILNLVYITRSFQALFSVQISLEFLFQLQLQRYHQLVFFSTIIGSKFMKANVRKDGNVTCKLQNFKTGFATAL